MSADPIRARALSLVGKGYSVFPAHVVRHADGTKDVRFVADWDAASSSSAADVMEWFADGHTWTDVCIDCGKSGIVVVDLDVRGDLDGVSEWERLSRDPGWVLATPGGRHRYFRNDPAEPYGSRNGAWPGIDVKGVGGLVFAYGFVPKAAKLPAAPAVLGERVKRKGSERSGVSGSLRTPQTYGQSNGESHDSGDPDGFSLPSQLRAFTKAQAEAFCAPAWLELANAPRGVINERLNAAAVTFSHFVPAFWSEADVTAWLVEAQRQAWVNAGGADDGDYSAAIATIRSGLGQGSDPWRAVRAADAPAAFGGRVDPEMRFEDALSEPLPTDDPLERLWGRFLDLDGLSSLKPAPPLVRGLLYAGTLASITGAYGSLKTFVALDIALCVASGTAWHGRAVRQGKVWYLLAEGVSGLRDRVNAWRTEWAANNGGVLLDLSGLRVLPEAIQVKDDTAWAMLCRLAEREKPDLIVVDTKARFTAGYEENSASDTATVVARVDALKRLSGGTALVVQHTGWGGDRMRGSSAWGGALDTDILVEKRTGGGMGEHDGPRARVKVVKQKDAVELEPFELQAKVIDLGVDVDGERVTSLAFDAFPFESMPPADEQITGALDVREEQHPEVLADLVAVMESVAPPGSPLGRTESEIRALMLLGNPSVHASVRRVARRGARAGQRGYERAAIHQAFVLAAAYGWLVPAQTPSRYTIASEQERLRALDEWRDRVALERAENTDETDR